MKTSTVGTVPVYVISGFLESGKTEFIKQTLSSPKFCRGEKILAIICEEGETEYDVSASAPDNIRFWTIEASEGLSSEALCAVNEEYRPSKVICEYNGMWLLDSLYSFLPDGWEIYKNFLFADSGTIMQYNTNMRQLTYDKLKNCDVALFNRFWPELDKLQYHKLVRGASTKADIVYQKADGTIEYDDIEDELPFDTNASTIVIRDSDYAVWYRDIQENTSKYLNKTVTFKGIMCSEGSLPGSFVIGRPLMTCCIEDVQFAGFNCCVDKKKILAIKDKEWVTVLADINPEKLEESDKIIPTLSITNIVEAKAPEQVIATF